MPALIKLHPSLAELCDKKVWGLLRKGSARKYIPYKHHGIACSSNNPDSLMPFTEALRLKKDDNVIVLSTGLASKALNKTLQYIDVDTYEDGYTEDILTDLITKTLVDTSPSGLGYHAFFTCPIGSVIRDTNLPLGYDLSANKFVTYTGANIGKDEIQHIENPKFLTSTASKAKVDYMSPYLPKEHDKLSTIWCFNMQTDVTALLEWKGYIRKGKKFISPTSSSGSPGIHINPSLKGPWECVYSHHDDVLHGKIRDPFDVYMLLTGKTKTKAIAELSQTTKAVDPTTGEILDISVADFNSKRKLSFSIKPCTPIQIMLDAYESTLSTPIKPFYTCTVYSHLSLFMQNTVKMPLMGMRGTNTLFMMLAFSAAGKDNNISVPTQGIARILQPLARKAGLNSVSELLEGMIHRMPKVTVLAALLKELSFEQSKRGRIWMDTDCKDLLGKFQGDGNNSGVSGLTDAIIEIADGIRITGMTKAQEELNSYDEAIPVLLASQTDVALELFTESLMARGFFGRFDFILHKDNEKTKIINPFIKGNVKPFEIQNEELIQWLLYCLTHAAKVRSNELSKYVVPDISTDALKALENWFDKHVSNPSEEWSEDRKKFISRVSMSIEKMATIDAWAEHMWNCFQKKEPNPYAKTITVSTENVERYFSYAEYQINVRNGEVLNLIKQKPKSIETKNERKVLDSMAELLKTPDQWKEKYPKLNVEIIKSHRLVNRSVLQQKCSINASTFKPLLDNMDGSDIIYHKKGDIVANSAGVEILLRGDYIGLIKN